jgi:hypothetical protein
MLALTTCNDHDTMSKDEIRRVIYRITSKHINMEAWQARVLLSSDSFDWVIDELKTELHARSMIDRHTQTPSVIIPTREEYPTLKPWQRLVLWLIQRAHAVSLADRRTMTFEQFVTRETCYDFHPDAWALRTHLKSASKSSWWAVCMADTLKEDEDQTCLHGWRQPRQPRALAEIANHLVDAPAAAIKMRA